MPGKTPGGHRIDDDKDRDQASDTEGHNMMINPGAGRDLARGRAKEVEREARDRQRAKEARGR
jgi:hypothetical protein